MSLAEGVDAVSLAERLNRTLTLDISGLSISAEQVVVHRPRSGGTLPDYADGVQHCCVPTASEVEAMSPFRTNSLDVALSIVEVCATGENGKPTLPLSTLRSASAQPPRAEGEASPSYLSLSCEVNQEFSLVNGSGCCGPPCGVKAVCGKRANMEDAHTVRTNFFDLPVSPSCAAEHICNRLPSRIAVQLGTTSTHPSPLGSMPVSPHATTPSTTSDHEPCSASTLVTGESSSSTSSELGCDTLHFFGVYDGHGGTEAAQHCATRLHYHLGEALNHVCGILRADDSQLQRLGECDSEFPSPGWSLNAQLDETHNSTATASTASLSVALPLVRGASQTAPCIPTQSPASSPTAANASLHAFPPAAQAAAATTGSSNTAAAVPASPMQATAAVAVAAAVLLDPRVGQVSAPSEAHSAPVSGVSWLAQRELLFKARGSFTPCCSRSPGHEEPHHHHHHDPIAGVIGRAKCGDDPDAGSGSDSEISGSGQSSGSSADSHAFRINSTTLTNLLEEALKDAFRKTDEEFACDGSASMVGSTAVVALVGSRKLFVANCGDSRAVLCRNRKAVQLTDDHKPEREDEAERVEKAGGQVLYWNGHRVMGVLAMSRAIGDHGLRPYIIPEPEITVLSRCEDDEFLLLASDGLWDVMSNQEAANLALRCLQRAREKGASSKSAVRIAASVLTKAAIDRGSKDNVTVVVVDLKAPLGVKAVPVPPPSTSAAPGAENPQQPEGTIPADASLQMQAAVASAGASLQMQAGVATSAIASM